MLCILVQRNINFSGETLIANVTLESFRIEMMNQVITENILRGKLVTANVAFKRFLMSHFMKFERYFRLESVVAGSALEDFSYHVLLLHVNHQLIFALEQEAAVIALQEPRVLFHVLVET
jgi:hypothetical protein